LAIWIELFIFSFRLNIILRAITDICVSLANKLMSKVLKFLKVITCKGYFIWRISKPFDIIFNLLNKLMRFLVGISIIVSQVTSSTVSKCRLKVYAYRFHVAYVKISIRFRGKTKTGMILSDFQVLIINFFRIAFLFDTSRFYFQ
jgi:hypothetical protein